MVEIMAIQRPYETRSFGLSLPLDQKDLLMGWITFAAEAGFIAITTYSEEISGRTLHLR